MAAVVASAPQPPPSSDVEAEIERLATALEAKIAEHGDEHILVPSGVLRWLDQAPPPRSERGAAPPKKKAKKPKR